MPIPAFQPFQHPLTSTSPGHWATLGNQLSFLPGETISLQVLCAANIIMVPRNIKLAQTMPSQGTYSNLDRVEPWRFISCAQRNSRLARVRSEPGTTQSAAEHSTTGQTSRSRHQFTCVRPSTSCTEKG